MRIDTLGIYPQMPTVEPTQRAPHPSIFEAALTRLDLPPSDVLFVGDSLDADYRGATAAGMPAVLIDRNGTHRTAAQHTVRSILELRDWPLLSQQSTQDGLWGPITSLGRMSPNPAPRLTSHNTSHIVAPMKTRNWPVQDAKARFSELLETCVREGPQIVTRRGEETAVLVPIEEWKRLCERARPSLKALLLTDFARADLPVPARGRHRRRSIPAL